MNNKSNGKSRFTTTLDYWSMWFSHRAAVPAILYDHTVRLLDSVSFTWHRDSSAIHLRQSGDVVGLFWPCDISAFNCFSHWIEVPVWEGEAILKILAVVFRRCILTA